MKRISFEGRGTRFQGGLRFDLVNTVAGIAVLSLALAGTTAHALPPVDPNIKNPGSVITVDPTPDPPCLTELVANSFTISPTVIPYPGSGEFQWNIYVPNGCTGLTFHISGQPVASAGTLAIQPSSDNTYYLRARLGNKTRELASVEVRVSYPPVVNITSSGQANLFAQAVGTPGTTVNVANNVKLDLSHRERIYVRGDVTIRGGRTSRVDGPLLFTTTRPRPLFMIDGDNVRITGLRIQGAEKGIADGTENLSKGIILNSNNNVEIDNNEIYGWSSVAIHVLDEYERIHEVINPETVRIHDNYIHNNQYYAKDGYGVGLGSGAYALIERNVFDWNRHSIAANGDPGTGYRAYRNLVLPNGGQHRWWPWPIGWQYTHAFDMHGNDNCGISDVFSDAAWNCGDGGHDMDIRYNSFLYTNGAAFKLRGTPGLKPYGAFVVNNVFAHSSLGDAVKQTESGLYTSGNILGVNGMKETVKSCDFDGDSVNDTFLATGQTWWFSSGGTRPWTYLNMSTKRTSQLTLGYFDNKAGCDVKVGDLVSSGGSGPLQAPNTGSTKIPVKDRVVIGRTG